MAAGTYTVGFEGLTIECIIGINDSERVTPQPLVVDMHARLRNRDNTTRAAVEDDTKAGIVINYSALATCCRRVITDGRFGLLETAAKRLADSVLCEYDGQIEWVRVHLRKPKALADAVATVCYEVNV